MRPNQVSCGRHCLDIVFNFDILNCTLFTDNIIVSSLLRASYFEPTDLKIGTNN